MRQRAWPDVHQRAAAVESRLKKKIAEKRGARLGTPAAAAKAASAPVTLEDKLRERLKGLFM